MTKKARKKRRPDELDPVQVAKTMLELEKESANATTTEEDGPLEVLVDDMKPIQERTAALLAQGLKVAEVARRLQVDRSTIHRWTREDPGFSRRVGDELARALDDVRDVARASYVAALDYLRDKLDGGLSGPVGVQAAGLLLKYAAPVVQVDEAVAEAAVNPDGTAVARARGRRAVAACDQAAGQVVAGAD